MSGARPRGFIEKLAGGGGRTVERSIAVERPCAIELNGIGYAVMMLTPDDLDDFALGFCWSERLIDRAAQVEDVTIEESSGGTLLWIRLQSALGDRLFERVRHRVSESSCGLCGIENLEQALRPLPMLPLADAIKPEALFRALSAMRDHQPLNRITGGVHAALACEVDGTILMAREDVGRHNAFDKLVGAMLRAREPWAGRFALLSSRCSYELVEKAVLAGCSTLATVSLPTTLALDRAAACGLRLITLARDDSFLVPEKGIGT